MDLLTRDGRTIAALLMTGSVLAYVALMGLLGLVDRHRRRRSRQDAGGRP